MISFEQPQPFSPAISSAYGRAAVMQQNNALFLQQQQMRQQQMLAQQEMQQRAAEATAAQQQHAAELAQRGELARQEMGFRQQELDAQPARDMFQAQAQMALQAQGAALHSYYSQQEMTQHESILLERKRQALAEVMNNPNLDAETRNNMALQIKTGIDPLEAKYKLTQMKQMQQAIQTAKTQEQMNAAKLQMASKAAAMTAAERIRPVYRDDALPEQLDAELTQKQQAGEVGDLSPQERQAYIRREAYLRGEVVGHSVTQPDGKVTLEPYKPAAGTGSAGTAGAGGVTGDVKAQQAAEEHALKMYQSASEHYARMFANEEKVVRPLLAKQLDKDPEQVQEDEIWPVVEKNLARRGITKPAYTKPELPRAAAREPWAGVLPGKPAAIAGQQQQQPAAGRPPAAGGSQKPEETVSAPPEPKTPQPKFEVGDIVNRPDKLTPDQKQKTAILADLAAKAAVAPGYSPAQRASFKAHLDWMTEKLAEYGSWHAFHKKEPKEYARMLRALDVLSSLPEPPQQPAGRPAAAPPAAGPGPVGSVAVPAPPSGRKGPGLFGF